MIEYGNPVPPAMRTGWSGWPDTVPIHPPVSFE